MQVLTTGLPTLVETVVTGVVAYLALVLLLRVSGKRTLAAMNAFDLVVTVALGSTLSAVLISKDVSALQGFVAFLTLIALQFAVTWTSVRVPLVRSIARSSPVVLARHGELAHEAMRRARVTPSEVTQAIRSDGHGSIRDVAAVVLETDGSFSVVPAGDHLDALDALDDVDGWDV